MKWVDTHCHLQLIDERLDSENLHNIEFLIIPGVDFESSLKAKEISSEIDLESYWSAGLHPHDAKLLNSQRQSLENLFQEADSVSYTHLTLPTILRV